MKSKFILITAAATALSISSAMAGGFLSNNQTSLAGAEAIGAQTSVFAFVSVQNLDSNAAAQNNNNSFGLFNTQTATAAAKTTVNQTSVFSGLSIQNGSATAVAQNNN